MRIPVYVINLKKSINRRERIERILNELSVPFQFIDAVDGYQLSDEELAAKVNLVWKDGTRIRNLLKGEIGCTLSHFSIYGKMVDENIETACILEDDAEPEKSFRILLSDDNLPEEKWDLLFLGHHSICSKKPAECINKKKMPVNGLYIGEPVELPIGSYGYIIKKDAAIRILGRGYPVRMPQDYYIGNAAAAGILVKALIPPCVNHDYELESTIYREKELIYGNSVIESFRKKVRKTYKWFPFLLRLRIMIAVCSNNLFILMRKTGVLRKTYAKY